MDDLVGKIAASLQEAANRYIDEIRKQEAIFKAQLDQSMAGIESQQGAILQQLGAVRAKTADSSAAEILSLMEQLGVGRMDAPMLPLNQFANVNVDPNAGINPTADMVGDIAGTAASTIGGPLAGKAANALIDRLADSLMDRVSERRAMRKQPARKKTAAKKTTQRKARA